MRPFPRSLLVLATTLSLTSARADITTLPGYPGYQLTNVNSLSGNGAVAVGASLHYHRRDIALRWDDGQRSRLDTRDDVSTSARRCSWDGSIVAGSAADDEFGSRAVRWRVGQEAEVLGVPDGFSSAATLSTDGRVIGGTRWDANERYTAFLWQEGVGTTFIELPNGDNGEVLSVGPDGRRISVLDGESGMVYAWSPVSGLRPLETLFGLRGVSASGRVFFGDHGPLLGPWRPFRYTEAGGIEYLPMLPGAQRGHVLASDFDGTAMVGTNITDGVQRHFYWSRTTGTVELQEFLISRGADLTGFRIGTPRAMSWDGNVIAGLGTYNGVDQPWLATVPEPGPIWIVAGGMIVVLSRRRAVLKN